MTVIKEGNIKSSTITKIGLRLSDQKINGSME
jgi:hypothetical protein